MKNLLFPEMVEVEEKEWQERVRYCVIYFRRSFFGARPRILGPFRYLDAIETIETLKRDRKVTTICGFFVPFLQWVADKPLSKKHSLSRVYAALREQQRQARKRGQL